MRKQSPQKKYGIKSVWIISYIIVFLIPLLVGVIAGTLMYNGFKSQVRERNNIVLNSACTTLDSHLKTVADASVRLYSNPYVNKICREFSAPLSETELEEINEFSRTISDIRGYDIIEKYSDSFFLYFSEIDYIVSAGDAQTSEMYYEKNINKNTYTDNDWNNLIKGNHGSSFFNARLLSEKNELFYVRTIMILSEEEKYVNAIYRVNTEKILEEIKNLYLYEYGAFSITNVLGETFLTFRGDPNYDNYYGDNDSELSFVKTSDVTGWIYTYSLPPGKAYGDVYKIFLIMIVLYILCLVAGIFLITYFIRKNYKPIDKLMTLFPENEKKSEKNEFSYLNDKITESLSQNFVLNQEIDSQSKMIREHLINEMLLGHPPVGRRSKTELENMEFNLETDSFAVLIYSFGNKDTDELSMKQFVLCNVTDELLSDENYKFASAKKDADVVYIVRIENDETVDKVKEISGFLLEFTKKELEFDFYSAMGSVREGEKSIGESYNEAKRTVEYAIASGNTELAEYKNVATSIKDGYFYSIELESRLVTLLKANEQKKMELLLNEIFRRNIGDEVSLDSIRYLTAELFATVKRLIAQYGYSAEKEYPEETAFIENIFECRDIDEMQKVIRGVYSSCGKNVFETLSHKDDLISGVVLYINQNYSNQNLGIRLIGEAFSMNPDYISRKFRENTGKTINDYIRDVRIEKAKQLLADSDELIADIAEMVGFTSYRTFVRVFSEVVGVTPNKYKTMK